MEKLETSNNSNLNEPVFFLNIQDDGVLHDEVYPILYVPYWDWERRLVTWITAECEIRNLRRNERDIRCVDDDRPPMLHHGWQLFFFGTEGRAIDEIVGKDYSVPVLRCAKIVTNHTDAPLSITFARQTEFQLRAERKIFPILQACEFAKLNSNQIGSSILLSYSSMDAFEFWFQKRYLAALKIGTREARLILLDIVVNSGEWMMRVTTYRMYRYI
jgi:hypothetical protein